MGMGSGSLGTSQVKRQSLRAAQADPKKSLQHAVDSGTLNIFIPSGSVVTAFAGVPLSETWKNSKKNSETWTSSELAETDTRGRVTLACSSNLAAAAIFHFPVSKLGSGTRICFYFQASSPSANVPRRTREQMCSIPEGFERSSDQVSAAALVTAFCWDLPSL